MRLAKLRNTLIEENLDAILITHETNRRYLSGFTGSAGTLIISQDRALLATDFRYYEQVEKQSSDFELFKVTGQLTDLLPDLLTEMGVHRLGYESDHVTVVLYQQLNDALPEGVEFVATSGVVREIRSEKDASELVTLQRAIDVTDAAYAHIVQFAQPGMTELEVAWELERFMRTHGAEKMAFIIVGSGPNGAMPHMRPTDRVIQAGDPIVFDIGAVVDGYYSDLTRTVALGEPSAKYLKVYEIVLRAQEAALQGVLPGMTGCEADGLARQVIEDAGYGDHFGHGLGHGIGMDGGRNKPLLSNHYEGGKELLRPGMVFTVEPGIYLPGEFGVRIEDDVILHQDGVRVLTQAVKEPYIRLSKSQKTCKVSTGD
ncbi:MAG: aminopeptidase P family protein [Chloroflexi bacterium]|nr:aminopeptidase P family protein [Chloroflexota bacterium]